jgi:hypothetical protein
VPYEKELSEGGHCNRLQGNFRDHCSLFFFTFLPGKESNKMRKIMFLGLLVVFLPAIVSAQEKIEGPVWNAGDKWTFTGDGSIEVMKADQNGYVLKFSDRNCLFESQGCNTIFLEKSTRNRVHAVEGDKHKKYTMGLRKILDFPLSNGKQWNYAYSAIVKGAMQMNYVDYSEHYKVLGWEDTQVRAGRFKALRMEYIRGGTGAMNIRTEDVKHLYWYSPEVKYFVKCQYDKDWLMGQKEVFNWELASFQLKK